MPKVEKKVGTKHPLLSGKAPAVIREPIVLKDGHPCYASKAIVTGGSDFYTSTEKGNMESWPVSGCQKFRYLNYAGDSEHVTRWSEGSLASSDHGEIEDALPKYDYAHILDVQVDIPDGSDVGVEDADDSYYGQHEFRALIRTSDGYWFGQSEENGNIMWVDEKWINEFSTTGTPLENVGYLKNGNVWIERNNGFMRGKRSLLPIIFMMIALLMIAVTCFVLFTPMGQDFFNTLKDSITMPIVKTPGTIFFDW